MRFYSGPNGDPIDVCELTGRAIDRRAEPLHRVDQELIDGAENTIAFQMKCRDCVWTATRPLEAEARKWARDHASNVQLTSRAEFQMQLLATNPRKAG